MVFGKKPPGIRKSQIERALSSSQPAPAIAPSGPKGHGKRKSPREKVWAPCRLIWPPNGRADGVCIDVSETGARIRFSHKIIVPDHLTMICARHGLNTECEIVRQDGFDAAVRFLS
jgi:hypothetical protein